MKLYKVIKNNKAKDGGNFDYTPYLPKNGKPGKWLPKIRNIAECERGYHVTPYWNMYDCEESQIYEVEVRGIQKKNEPGTIDKYVVQTMRLIKKYEPAYLRVGNTGHWNTGDLNTGSRNTGSRNTGDRNTGHSNTGRSNTGHLNTGHSNTGSSNTGSSNTGSSNTGDWNTGDWNTGSSNTGHSNTGHSNTGHSNTGHSNTGDWNTGDWNTGDFHSGWFNTKKIRPIRLLFGKPITRQPIFPEYFFFDLDGNYKTCWKRAFDNASIDEIEQTIQLENFDYKMFQEITGITKKMIVSRLKK